MSDCENQWVVLYHKPDDRNYTYGFVYIDPQAGFTLHITGSFTIDSEGKYRPHPTHSFPTSSRSRFASTEMESRLHFHPRPERNSDFPKRQTG